MVRNYSQEARISKVNAESIIRRAMVVTLLYSLASAFLLSFVWLFVMEVVDFHGFTKVAEDPSTHTLVLMQAINDLTSGMSNMVGDIIVLSVPAICIVYVVLKIISIIIKLGNVEGSVKNPHLVANKSNLKGKKRVCKLCIAEARRLKDKGKLYAAKRRLKEVKQKEREVIRFYRFNRYAKNAQTETVYRYWVNKVEKCGKLFFTGFRLIATAFFAFMLVESTGLIEYVKDLATFDEINTQKPLPTIFDALTPAVTFGENAKDTLYLQWVYIALAVGLVFQFIAGPISGKITRVRLSNHEITYMHTRAIGWIDQVDYNHSNYNLNRNIHGNKLDYLDDLSGYDEYSAQPKMLGGSYSSELQPYYAGGYASIPRRWDDSDAILEERGRELGVGLFFVRNLIQVVCMFLLVGVFVYLFPALEQIERMEQRNLMGIPCGTIFLALKWLMILHLVNIIWYVLSAKEYDFDMMHEETEHRRRLYRAALIWLAIWAGIYFALLFVPEVVESSAGQLYSIKTLFEIAVPNNDPTAVGAFVPVFNKIVSTFVTFLLIIVAGFLGEVVFRPKERKKKVKEGDDFFAISRSWRNISLDDDDE